MKKFALLSLFVVLFFAVSGFAATILFYGGDFNANDPNANGLANETDGIVGGSPYGAATFQNFVIPDGQRWDVESLFTNNLTNFVGPQSAYWEIRSGVSEGNGGNLIASGTGNLGNNFTWTPTGRSGFGLLEYQAHVTMSSIDLGPGQYWFAVVPNDDGNNTRSFNSNTPGPNCAIGNCVPGQEFFNSAFFGANYTNANNEGAFNIFSSGVDGTVIPEPSSLIMLGSGLLGVVGVIRRRLM
jgi:hypothetical protein